MCEQRFNPTLVAANPRSTLDWSRQVFPLLPLFAGTLPRRARLRITDVPVRMDWQAASLHLLQDDQNQDHEDHQDHQDHQGHQGHQGHQCDPQRHLQDHLCDLPPVLLLALPHQVERTVVHLNDHLKESL